MTVEEPQPYLMDSPAVILERLGSIEDAMEKIQVPWSIAAATIVRLEGMFKRRRSVLFETVNPEGRGKKDTVKARQEMVEVLLWEENPEQMTELEQAKIRAAEYAILFEVADARRSIDQTGMRWFEKTSTPQYGQGA